MLYALNCERFYLKIIDFGKKLIGTPVENTN